MSGNVPSRFYVYLANNCDNSNEGIIRIDRAEQTRRQQLEDDVRSALFPLQPGGLHHKFKRAKIYGK